LVKEGGRKRKRGFAPLKRPVSGKFTLPLSTGWRGINCRISKNAARAAGWEEMRKKEVEGTLGVP